MLYYCILGPSKLKSTNVRIPIRSCSYFSMLLFSLPCFASLCWNVIYVSSINNLIIRFNLSSSLVSRDSSCILFWPFHDTFSYTMLESICWCTAGKYKDCYLVWESVIIGVSACPCNSSHCSEARHLSNIDPQWSFSSQILTIPFLWQFFPYLKEVAIFWITLLLGLNRYSF